MYCVKVDMVKNYGMSQILLIILIQIIHLPTPGEPESRAALKYAPLSSFAQGPFKTNFYFLVIKT